MRVMNVKFVGRIIMTVLFVFICIGAHAGVRGTERSV